MAKATPKAPTGKRLVIVESPHKAKTIASYLGPGYVVEASVGHVRDLPKNAADVPASHKKLPWARLGVDVDHGFDPLYVVSSQKNDQVKRLRSLLKEVDEVYLATDGDREGEAIAWHLLELLKPKVPVKRMVFHEITPAAIQAAVAAPRSLDDDLVSAQETRRILDRLYGYEVSPVLWKKVMPRLSAGRVQSVATRVLVERERERIAFTSASYWDLLASLAPDGAAPFDARLVSVSGSPLASGKDFGPDGTPRPGVLVLAEDRAHRLAAALPGSLLSVTAVDERPSKRTPAPPFMTSTLQQEASRKLRWDAARTMRNAQRLYEAGLITYMRTDSLNLSVTALAAARACATSLYGPASVPAKPREYRRKVKNAQEAHEAIRPAGDTFRSPDDVAAEVSVDEARLYRLIWSRTVASQMVDAQVTTTTVLLSGDAGEPVELRAAGTVVKVPGFLRVYEESSDDSSDEASDPRLPSLSVGQDVPCSSAEPRSHTTSPPSRYTEASLVKRLEELGIGRPSTYASIISTIVERGYARKAGSALVPTFTAFAVVQLLEQHFPQLVDYSFTAAMEDDLDQVASGSTDSREWLGRFYFGDGTTGLHPSVESRLAEIDARAVSTVPLGSTPEGEVVVRVGRYGPYVARGEERASVPEDLAPEDLTLERALELLAAPKQERLLGESSQGELVHLRVGRFGPYVEAVAEGAEPRRASLLPSMAPDTLTLAEAEGLLSLPRTLGPHPDSGEPVTVQNGPYGPYVRCAKESRSVPEAALFSMTLEEALPVLAAPKERRARTAKPPLKELGPDPVSGRPVVLKEGRFGPYVTDGETNATLGRSEDPAGVDDGRAFELLAERRAKGPVQKRPRRKRS